VRPVRSSGLHRSTLVTPSILETRLAAVLMGELFPRQDLDDTYVDIILDDFDLDDDYYAAFELVSTRTRRPSSCAFAIPATITSSR
jgi:hypothetical protein